MSFRTDHDPVGVSSGRRAAMPPALKTTSDRARAELGRDVLQPPTGGDCGVTRELRGVRCALERGR